MLQGARRWRCCSGRAPAAARWPWCRPTGCWPRPTAGSGPLPPEGASAIVHRDVDHAGEMAAGPGRAGHRPVAGRDRRPRRARSGRTPPTSRPSSACGWAGCSARSWPGCSAGTTPSASAAGCTATATSAAEAGQLSPVRRRPAARRLWSGSSRSTTASSASPSSPRLLGGQRVEHRLADGVDVPGRDRPDDVPAGVGEDGEVAAAVVGGALAPHPAALLEPGDGVRQPALRLVGPAGQVAHPPAAVGRLRQHRQHDVGGVADAGVALQLGVEGARAAARTTESQVRQVRCWSSSSHRCATPRPYWPDRRVCPVQASGSPARPAARPSSAQTPRVRSTDHLRRNSSTAATSGDGQRHRAAACARSGSSSGERTAVDRHGLGEQRVDGEVDAEVGDDADHGGGDAGERRRQRPVAAQPLDVRRAEQARTGSTARRSPR